MGVGEHAQHAEGLVVLDEPHASHVGRQLVDVAGTAAYRAADAKVAGVAIGRAGEVLRCRRHLIPVFKRLDVDRPHVAGAEIEQLLDEMATDESAATCHHHDPLVHLQSPSSIDDASLAVILSFNMVLRFSPQCNLREPCSLLREQKSMQPTRLLGGIIVATERVLCVSSATGRQLDTRTVTSYVLAL